MAKRMYLSTTACLSWIFLFLLSLMEAYRSFSMSRMAGLEDLAKRVTIMEYFSLLYLPTFFFMSSTT